MTLVILVATVLLVAGDVIGALTGKPLGFPYSPLGIISLLVYLTVGLLGVLRTNFVVGVLAAATVGFLDGTLGPLLAWLAGPGSVGQTITEPRIFAYSAAVGTAAAAGVGIVGAAAGSWVERRRGVQRSRVVPR